MDLILGGFHTMMSIIGSIGALTNGSSLLECLETKFRTNIIPRIIDGKAISRATCAHFLSDCKTTCNSCFCDDVKVEEANENVEINDMNLDAVNDGITDEN